MQIIRNLLTGVVAAGVSSVASTGAAMNLLVDGGFEDNSKFTADGPPFVGLWEAFSGSGDPLGTNPLSMPSTDMPFAGAQHLALDIDNVANSFAGLFQDVPVAAGTLVEYSVYHKALAGSNGQGIEARIEYRDSVTDTEISRTANMTPASLGTDYELFSFQDTVPVGADTARWVYAIQSFGGPATQKVYVDNASLTPEPATAALLGVGGLLMLRRRVA